MGLIGSGRRRLPVSGGIPSKTIADLRQDQASTVIYVNEGVKSGVFVYDPNDTTSVDDGVIIIVSGSRRYKRQFEGDVRASWYNPDPMGVADSTSAMNSAAAAAKLLGKNVEIGEGSFRINGEVVLWTGIKCSTKSEFLISSSGGKITLNPTSPEYNLTATEVGAITGLTKGSMSSNLTGRKDQTILIRSTAEKLIDRWDNGPITPYYKRQLIRITDNEGSFNAPLQQTFSDQSSALVVRAYAPERLVVIDNLKIRIASIVTGQTPFTINRSDVVVNDLWVVNEDNSSNGSIGVAINKGYNIEFNNPYISGFTDENNVSGRVGYGIQPTECYDIRINNPHVVNCKHTIMASFCTKVRIRGGVLVGVDNSGTGSANLQPLDTHWSVDFEVEDVSIYSKYGSVHGICVAGKDIAIRNCKIYNCWSICGMSATTPEIDGYWIARGNYIEFTPGASHMYALGSFTSGADYGSTFTRALIHPKLIQIVDNKFVNPNTTNFLLYRGITSIFENGKWITERLEVENNISLTGQQPWTLATSQLLQIREENKVTTGVTPQIVITAQPFEVRDYDTTTPAIRIYTRNKATMTTPYSYDLIVNGRGDYGYSFEVDVDALNRAFVSNVDIVSLNGAQTLVGGETKTPSFFWELSHCAIGSKLPSGKTKAFLNVGSARIKWFGCYVVSNFKLRSSTDGSKGPDQFTNFDDAIVAAGNVTVKKNSQFDTDDVTVIVPPFKTSGWINKTYLEGTNDSSFYNFATAIPVASDVFSGKFTIIRQNDDSFGLYANHAGILYNLLATRIGTSITSTSNVTARPGFNSFSASSASGITATIQASNYVFAGNTILQFRNVGVGDLTIALGAGVTVTGAPFTLTTNDELVLVSTGANTYRIYHLKQKAILSEIQAGSDNTKHLTSKGLSDFFVNLPVYADNAAAETGGLAVGKPYKTGTGDVKIRV